jgi:hypothetical protein
MGRQLVRTKRRWEDNTKMCLKETKSKAVDWIPLTHDGDQLQAYVNPVIHLSVQQQAGNFLTGRTITIFSRSTLLCGVS